LGYIKTRDVSHCSLAIHIKETLGKRRIMGNSNISPCKNIILEKNPLKKTKNPSRYYNFMTNLKFQHKPKYHLSKILI
jgi:hypothetical protein